MELFFIRIIINQVRPFEKVIVENFFSNGYIELTFEKMAYIYFLT